MISHPTSFPHSSVLVVDAAALMVFSGRIDVVKGQPPPPPPEEMTLRVGILHAPPFAMIAESRTIDNNNDDYTGFTPDLLNHMIDIALQEDNVQLNIIMKPSPQQYNPAFDLIANDCSTGGSGSEEEECDEFDVMAPNYYATSSRSIRSTLTPPIQKSSISTIKLVTSPYTTIAQASDASEPICLKEGTFYAGLVQEQYPDGVYLMCPNTEECIQELLAGSCVLNADDELQLRYQASLLQPETLQVTNEQFNTQYIVWAMKDSLPDEHKRYFQKWMWDANTATINDMLYVKYFATSTAGGSDEQQEEDGPKVEACGECICDGSFDDYNTVPLFEQTTSQKKSNSRKGGAKRSSRKKGRGRSGGRNAKGGRRSRNRVM